VIKVLGDVAGARPGHPSESSGIVYDRTSDGVSLSEVAATLVQGLVDHRIVDHEIAALELPEGSQYKRLEECLPFKRFVFENP
jgi:hypothetical protein